MSRSKHSTTFTGGSPALSIVGDYCYAYSGSVAVDGSATEMLNFHSSDNITKCLFEIHGVFSQIGQNQIRVLVEFNNVTVIDTYFDASLDMGYLDKSILVIPPLTNVKISMSQASGSDRNMQVTLTGRIY